LLLQSSEFAGGVGEPAWGQIIYVDASATRANDGSSWADAYSYLQDALAGANTAEKPAEIRIAQGLYTPDQGAGITPGDQCATFQLISGVAIYGGYAGVAEPDPDERNVGQYESVLSGDLNGDDVEPEDLFGLYFDPTRRDNSSHVVTGSFTDQTAVLDGFTITAGRYSWLACRDSLRGGAGMVIESGSPTIVSCLFAGNAAFGPESIMANLNGSSPTLIDCTFSSNYARAAMENEDSSPALAHCTFTYNSRTPIDSNGDCYLLLTDCAFAHNLDGIDNSGGSDASLTNCTFAHNSGGMHNGSGSNATLTNCTFEFNGEGMGNSGDASLTNCTFAHNRQGMRNSGDARLTNCTFAHNRQGMRNSGDAKLTDCTFEYHSQEAIHHGSGSLSLTRCLFGHNSGSSGVGIDSWSGQLTATDCTFVDNVAIDSGGAIRCLGGDYALHNCEFGGNVADRGGAIHHSNGPGTISNCVFAGNVARESDGGAIYSRSKYTTVQNCTFSNNFATESGSALYAWKGATVQNCILLDNSLPAIGFRNDEPLIRYSNVQGGWPGEGNIDLDPGFVEQGYWDANDTPEDVNDDRWVGGDYHLLSQAGRWDTETQSWVRDDVTSPCIDAGDPNSPIGIEPFPNGGRANMGAYGTSDEAGKTYFGEPVCEIILAGDINGDCVVDFEDLAIVVSHWLMHGEDFVNKPPTVTLIEPQDGDRIAWPGPTTFRVEADDSDGEVDSVSVSLKYTADNFYVIRSCSLDSDGTGEWEGDYTWKGDITDGNWTVKAQATDNEGVVSVSSEIVVTLYRP
jgi:parallel beta-helix repeat protein/predicted outer membrane repeat protein